ncbi:DNA-binding response regulator [Oceanobacillus piezotolerans]|uniref:DNA-binding response regulator n=1 Tax=Oceanobacillus piezotolerans TaxID=2448030 RepID=A0A498DKI2_9BACI|nr:LytTR family DNA-binding domain-containing protein [Oceanobacillus piezotolerans]RLL46992.1 DNA-binding response regulator [Oceanobacillus piezotolerans]
MFRAYIVDDEPLARDELKYLLVRSKRVEILGESDNVQDAITEITEMKPDVVFLDIELSEDNGLSLAKELETMDSTPAIVFATAYDEYALQAFELNAVDYILKPFDEERVHKTLEKTEKMVGTNKHITIPPLLNGDRNGKIPVLVGDRIILLAQADILYLESNNGKCIIKTIEQEYKVNEALVVLEKKLSNIPLLRVHRSYVVNLDYIAEIEPWFNSTYNLIMKDSSKVPVSRTYVKQLKQIIGI